MFDSDNGANDDIKFHENMLSNILPRIFRHTQSKDVIKVMTMSFIVLLVILVGYLPSSSGDWSSPMSENAFFPRHVRYLINEMGEGVEVQRLSLDVDHYPLKRAVRVSRRALKRQEHLNEGSEDYAHSRASDFETTKCKAQHPWQLMTFPTCNILYEYDLTSIYTEQQEHMETRMVAHGHYRDVWMVKEFNAATRVLKTLRYKHDFEGRFFGRNRKDALISERMTKSPHVVDIYGFCGNSALFEYSRDGDITATVFPKSGRHNLTMMNKVEIATQLASALADLHNFDKEGEASVVHADINPSQFVLIDGSFKLNDFNRGVLMQWSKQRNESCGYYMNLNEGKMRSPEEYSYTKQSEKVDIYSMGNIFYLLLTETWPFADVTEEEAQQLIMKGRRPHLPEYINNSNDTLVQTLKRAMILCYKQNVTERASGRQVEIFLKERLLELKANNSLKDPDSFAQ